jgi:hypothetical protein
MLRATRNSCSTRSRSILSCAFCASCSSRTFDEEANKGEPIHQTDSSRFYRIVWTQPLDKHRFDPPLECGGRLFSFYA